MIPSMTADNNMYLFFLHVSSLRWSVSELFQCAFTFQSIKIIMFSASQVKYYQSFTTGKHKTSLIILLGSILAIDIVT